LFYKLNKRQFKVIINELKIYLYLIAAFAGPVVGNERRFDKRPYSDAASSVLSPGSLISLFKTLITIHSDLINAA
jgi:hypothetical protein